MKKDNSKSERLGDEAPGPEDFIIVIVATAILIALSWIAYYRFGWFH